MRFGIIGSRHIGGTLAKLFVAAGHEVAVSNSRGPETLAGLVAELGARGQAMTAEDAERFGEVVVVSVPLGRYREVPADAVEGKVVIDTNNYYPQRDGHFPELDDDGRPAGGPERLGIPISGDDEQAKRTVAELIDEIGFDPVDAGTLAQGGRKHQPGTPAYTQGLPTAALRARLA